MRHSFSSSTLALVALLVLAKAPAQEGCECLWQGSFADVAPTASAVVAGSVIRRKGNSVDLQLEETLRGQVFREEMRVWMHTRDYCRPSAEAFPVGSRWVMALTHIEDVPEGGFDPGTPNESYGRVGDYYLSSCGGYWLSYRGDAVTGNLVNGPRWAREVDMTPVLIDLLRAFLGGTANADALAKASREDPALRELRLDTRAFLRGQGQDSR